MMVDFHVLYFRSFVPIRRFCVTGRVSPFLVLHRIYYVSILLPINYKGRRLFHSHKMDLSAKHEIAHEERLFVCVEQALPAEGGRSLSWFARQGFEDPRCLLVLGGLSE